MFVIKLAAKNQVTIPSKIREELSFQEGDILYGSIENERLVLTSKRESTRPVDYRIRLRDRYQFTLPKKLCESLWVSDEHVLHAFIEEGQLVIVPKAIVDSLGERDVGRIIEEVENVEQRDTVQFPGLQNFARWSKKRRREC